jgi:probable rRNA maturation factor
MDKMTELELEFLLQAEPDVSSALSEERLAGLTKLVLEENGQSGRWAITILLTSDVHIQQLHRDYMGIDTPTDVMTFPADPVEGETDAGGDIVISVEQAAEQGPEHGLTKEQEIEFLIVHGLLHLCGWDDHDDDDRASMLDYQAKMIREFDIRTNTEL